MDFAKKKLLEEAHQKLWEVGITTDAPLSYIHEVTAEDIMGFGTTADEKIISQTEMYDLILRQREQADGLESTYRTEPVLSRVLAGENAAVFADDLYLTINIAGEKIEMYMRFTTVFEYKEGKWLAVHFHGSKPEEVSTESDTFGIEEWKQKNELLEKLVAERTLELQQQKEALEKTLLDLRNTQAQLIQSEKMASLGELTAGIAHEIQNPLNFVNNFSEINQELLQEMNEEIANENYEDVQAIAKDITDNAEKIVRHGKRADSIVKGMLQHSRSSTAVKEPVDINKLADEYFRLAYHGLRAKDKSFNAVMQTEYDENIGSINAIPQDIGRVILNLITNAFYAVSAKKKISANDPGSTYEPTVSVNTKKENNNITISVTDNGDGIDEKILDKIFQPFFTTKPTGEGTGLGLSMSNDIVTKGHSGALTVKTEQGKGTTFTITLPA